jgi:hypothetical protein
LPTPKAGYKLKSGEKVVGVTTVLNRWKESGGLLQWAFQQGQSGASSLYEKRDEAADVGTHCHALVEAHINGTPTPAFPSEFTDEMKKSAQQAFDSFRLWEDQSHLTVVEQEMSLVSEKYRFGGTPDAIAMIGNQPCLLDWKSSKGVYYDFLIQCAAYLNLYEENHPETKLVGGIHIVRFGKAGGDFTHRHFAADHPALAIAWFQFLAFRDCYDRDKEIKKYW